MAHYDASSIVQMSEIDHLRKHSGMYVGDAETATRLLEEVLDNSLDEVQNNFATIVGVFVDTKEKNFKVLDNGRGFPFDQSLPLDKDPPIMACTKLFTSGKFQKGSDNAYGIAVGLHGVGLSAVYALSEYMNVDIFRDNKHAMYMFKHDGSIDRTEEVHKDKKPFSTKIEVKPSTKYFTDTKVDLKRIEERLRIAVANFPKLKVVFRVDGEDRVIEGSVDDLILNYIGNGVTWLKFTETKGQEGYDIRVAWDDKPPASQKCFTTVNLCRVESGAHINHVLKVIREFFQDAAGKSFTFQANDSLTGLRLYIDLRIVSAAFAEQVKDRLSSRSDLAMLDSFKTKLIAYFKEHKEELDELLERFHNYRAAITNKSLVGVKSTSSKKRGMTTLTKLHDCTEIGGELIICEGDSAGGNLVMARDPKVHAILGLQGVIPNAITKKDFHTNKELKDIIIACGCGIEAQCDVRNLRYSKIILAADADPAGHWITSLLITLFAYKMPPVVKAGRLYVCSTPLYGYKKDKKFIPLWTQKEIDDIRNSKYTLMRFKGLGEFDANDLKYVAMDNSTRRLIQVQWCEEHKEKLFDLMSSAEARKQLVMGEWTLS
jgi:DNA gyrase subunit B